MAKAWRSVNQIPLLFWIERIARLDEVKGYMKRRFIKVAELLSQVSRVGLSSATCILALGMKPSAFPQTFQADDDGFVVVGPDELVPCARVLVQ